MEKVHDWSEIIFLVVLGIASIRADVILMHIEQSLAIIAKNAPKRRVRHNHYRMAHPMRHRDKEV